MDTVIVNHIQRKMPRIHAVFAGLERRKLAVFSHAEMHQMAVAKCLLPASLRARIVASIPRAEWRILFSSHRRSALVRLSTLLCKPMSPSHRPIVEGARIGKQVAHSRVAVGAGSRVAQPAEDQGEIDAITGHALEEVLC